jgi:hypothetical protein
MTGVRIPSERITLLPSLALHHPEARPIANTTLGSLLSGRFGGKT